VLGEPWCHFCRHKNDDGSFSFDYAEHHAILLGALTPFFMWPFIVRHSTQAAKLVEDEPWYVAGGMAAQALVLVALLRRSR